MNPHVRAANPWSMPQAQLVLPADAEEQQWLDERRKGLGSSDAAVLMGLPQGSDTEYQLWLDKTGRLEQPGQTEAMRRGKWLEPHVADYFANETGLQLRRCGLVENRQHAMLRATPDRLTSDGGLLEVKTIGQWSQVKHEWRDGVARHAWVQGQWQLMVTGRSRIWFCCYAIDQQPMIRGPYDRDEPLIERMTKRGIFWWDTYVVGDLEPPIDLDTITDEEINQRWPTAQPDTTIEVEEWAAAVKLMLQERAEAKELQKTWEGRVKLIDRDLRLLAKDAEALTIGGKPVVTFKKFPNNPTVSKTLAEDHPEIWEKYIKQGTHRRIHVVKGWDQT